MTEKEMLTIIDDTIDTFIDGMPLVPFSKDDVVVDFFTLQTANERYVKFCQRYFPRKLDGRDYQNAELYDDAAAMAMVGEEKVGLMFRSDLWESTADFRHSVFHELAHIYCLLCEMPRSEHFIDIYLGCTPETDFSTPEERQEDGMVSAGYEIWREFIADYIAILLDSEGFEHDFRSGAQYMREMLKGVGCGKPMSKRAMSNFLVAVMTCSDVDNAVKRASGLVNSSIRPLLTKVVEMVYAHIVIPVAREWNVGNNYPWMIDRQFIRDLGSNYLMFLTCMMLS